MVPLFVTEPAADPPMRRPLPADWIVPVLMTVLLASSSIAGPTVEVIEP